MHFKKFLSVLCLIFVLAVCGCGQNKTANQPVTKEYLNEKGITPIEKVLDPAKLPAPAAKEEVILPADIAPQPQPVAANVTEVPVPAASPAAGDIIIADFEGWPNLVGGEIGVFGSLEPDWDKANQQPVSWVYESTSLNYSPENVHSGKNSFRLVNGIGIKPEYTWGSFAMDLGPTTDITPVPKKVESMDVSGYKYLTFWVKGAKGGEKMEFLARDAHALNYSPQIKYKLPDAATEWKKITIPLSELSSKVDLTKLDNIGIAFGKDVGNLTADTIYLDDFAFTNNP